MAAPTQRNAASLRKLLCPLVALACAACLMASCAKPVSAHSTEDLEANAQSAAGARQTSGYVVELPDDAAQRVLEDAAAAAQASSTTGMGNALAFSFDLSHDGTVTLYVETLSSNIENAKDTATELAVDFADYATVTDVDGNEVEARSFMGALYDVYDLAIELCDHDGTFSLSGGKTTDQDEITWQ